MLIILRFFQGVMFFAFLTSVLKNQTLTLIVFYVVPHFTSYTDVMCGLKDTLFAP